MVLFCPTLVLCFIESMGLFIVIGLSVVKKARNYLIENKDVCEEIRRKVLEAGGYVEDMSEVLEGIDKDAKAHPPKS